MEGEEGNIAVMVSNGAAELHEWPAAQQESCLVSFDM